MHTGPNSHTRAASPASTATWRRMVSACAVVKRMASHNSRGDNVARTCCVDSKRMPCQPWWRAASMLCCTSSMNTVGTPAVANWRTGGLEDVGVGFDLTGAEKCRPQTSRRNGGCAPARRHSLRACWTEIDLVTLPAQLVHQGHGACIGHQVGQDGLNHVRTSSGLRPVQGGNAVGQSFRLDAALVEQSPVAGRVKSWKMAARTVACAGFVHCVVGNTCCSRTSGFQEHHHQKSNTNFIGHSFLKPRGCTRMTGNVPGSG